MANTLGALASRYRFAQIDWPMAPLALSVLLSSLGTSIANVALPSMANAFGASISAVQWVVVAYLLGVTSLIVGAGRLGDVMGRRRLLITGIGVFVAASALGALAPNLPVLIAARAVQGIGAAVMLSLGMALVGNVVPKSKTGTAMGLLGTMSAIGTALGPSLGGILIVTFGWASIFAVTVPVGMLTIWLALHHLPRDEERDNSKRASFDIGGTLVLAVALASYALAMTLGRGDFGPVNLALIGLTIAGVGVLAFIEQRASSPLIDMLILHDRALTTSLATGALIATVMMTTLIVGPFYLSLGLGLDIGFVGLAMSIGPLVAAVTASPAGALVDRLGAQRMTMLGIIGVGVGALSLALLPTTFGVVAYVGPVVVMTFSYALFQTANNTAVLRDVNDARRGVISGLLNLSRNLGLITGASMMGAVFAASSAFDGGVTPRAASFGMQVSFGVAALLAGLAAFAALANRGVR